MPRVWAQPGLSNAYMPASNNRLVRHSFKVKIPDVGINNIDYESARSQCKWPNDIINL